MLFYSVKAELLKDDEKLKELEKNYREAKQKLIHYLEHEEGAEIVPCKKSAPDMQHRAQIKGLNEMSDDEIKEFADRFLSIIHDMREEAQEQSKNY